MIKKILVSQPKPKSDKSPYFDLEKKYHVEIVFSPLIHVERLTTKEFRAQRVNILDFTAIVFTSHHAIDHFFSLCKDLRITMPEDMKYFFISERVALYVQKYVKYRKRKVFFPKEEESGWNGLVDVMSKHKKESYFVPQSNVSNVDVAGLLDGRGLQHKESVMYKTVSTPVDKSKPFDYDMIIFFTPSGVRSLKENFPDYEQGDVRFGCLGTSTARTIREMGFRLDVEAPTPEAPSITAALDLYLSEHAK